MNEINFESNLFINNEKNNEEEQLSKMHIIERQEMKLSLRKKKLNEKIFNQRIIEIQNNENKNFNLDKPFLLKNSFIKLISRIEIECNEEQKIIDSLKQISNIIENIYRSINIEVLQNNTFKFNSDDLINNNWIEIIY